MITSIVSPRPTASERLIHAGRNYQAEWYFTPAGEMPALEYYRGLPSADRVRFIQIVRQFCDRQRGDYLPPTMYRIEDAVNQIYAFKPNAERFFNFMTSGAKVIVTNAYQKDSKKMSKAGRAQLAVAAGYKVDYLQRVARGTYYG